MLVYDDMEPSEKVRVYDRGIQVRSQEGIYKALVDYRMGDVWSPKVDVREALSVECEHFVNCIRTGTNPNSDGESGLAGRKNSRSRHRLCYKRRTSCRN